MPDVRGGLFEGAAAAAAFWPLSETNTPDLTVDARVEFRRGSTERKPVSE